MRTFERRFFSTTLRALSPAANSSNSPGTLQGYAALYSHPGKKQNLSSDLGGFKERLAPNCFARSLRNGDDVHALWNHSPMHPLGRVANGSLKLRSDDVGLHMTVELPNTSYGRDLFESVKRGDVADQSFGFQCEDQDWDDCDDPDDRTQRIRVRTVKGAKLVDVSPCTFPAYPGTSVVHVSSMDPAIMGRSHSFESMFPEGLPAEVRSRLGVSDRSLDVTGRRRNFTNLILGL
jgi:HK97 family phage prohead protease